MKNTTEVLTKAEASIAAVDRLLIHLDQLNHDAQTLSESIATLQNDEAEILASDKAADKRLKPLLEVRAKLSLAEADLAKIRNEISALQSDLRTVGDKANLFVGALIDALTVARRNRVTELLKGIFIDRVIKELTSYSPYSLLLQEVEPGVERLQFYPVARVEDNVATARKVRPTFSALKSLVEAEANIDLIVGENW